MIVWDCNKEINNPNGVSIIDTLYNCWSEEVKYPNIVQYMYCTVFVLCWTPIVTYGLQKTPVDLLH
jgi:hypothetical protein